MNNTNFRADQARSQARTIPENNDWRTQIHPETRQRIVNELIEALRFHISSSGQEAMLELKNCSVRWEERIYTSSTNQIDYSRNISLMLMAIDTNLSCTRGNDPHPDPGTSNQNAADSVSGGIRTHVHNQSQQLPMPIMGNQSQAHQQLLLQNIQNNMTSTGMQSSASLTTAPPSVAPASLPNVHGQNSSLQSMQNVSNVAQNSMANSMGQGMPSNMFANNQRQMLGRQQQVVSQQSQNPRHLLDPKFPQESMSRSLGQPHIQRQQQQKQYISQQSQHTLMQSTVIPSPPLSNLQQNQQSSTRFEIGDLQQQANTLPRDMQQRLQTSSPLLHDQNVVDPQKQLFQPQTPIPDGPSNSTAQTGSAHGADWQEEAYRKISSMKEMYFVELRELYQRAEYSLAKHAISQQPDHEYLERAKLTKAPLEKIFHFLRVEKNDIQIAHRDQIGEYENLIVRCKNKSRRACMRALQQNQQSETQISQMQPHESRRSCQMQSSMNIQGSVVPQHQLSESQISQIRLHESQVNSQMQSSMNIQGSVMPMQQNSLANVQHNSLPSAYNISNPQQLMVNSHSGSCLDATQGNAQSSLQQVALDSIRQNPVSGSQQMNMNSLASQSGMNNMQSNRNKLQQNSNMSRDLQSNQKLQILQSQYSKQLQPQQFQQQFLHTRSILLQQQKPAQLSSPNMSQIHQINEASDLDIRKQMGVKSGILQQHHPAGPCAYHHPHRKAALFISSPSLQVTQPLSPQIDQQNMPTLIPKAGTPLQSLSSPFIVPSPSTPSDPSPMLAETENLNTGVSPLSETGAIGHQQATVPSAPAQSLAIDTPGISASPLLAEFTSPDGTHRVGDGHSTTVEQPHERLMRLLKSISSEALIAAVSDISSVVIMADRIAGAAPGNGSRADLVSTTKKRLHERHFFTQEGPPALKKMRRHTSAALSNVFSSASCVQDIFRQINCSEASDRALIEEMLEINRRLVDTNIEISNEGTDPSVVASAAEGGEGTIVKCSYNAVALSPNFKALYSSAQMAPIQPLWLLVPKNYPHCSPILLDKFPVESSSEYDLSMKVKSKFSNSLRSLSQPVSLSDVARTWDGCARAIMTEYAQQTGGGTFSSKYGTWENCVIAA